MNEPREMKLATSPKTAFSTCYRETGGAESSTEQNQAFVVCFLSTVLFSKKEFSLSSYLFLFLDSNLSTLLTVINFNCFIFTSA